MGEFIVIEKHGGWQYASPVTDEEGNNKIFTNLEDAQAEADECQDGIVVGDEVMSKNEVSAIGLINDTVKFLELVRFDPPPSEDELAYQARQQKIYDREELKKRIKQWQKSIQI